MIRNLMFILDSIRIWVRKIIGIQIVIWNLIFILDSFPDRFGFEKLLGFEFEWTNPILMDSDSNVKNVHSHTSAAGIEVRIRKEGRKAGCSVCQLLLSEGWPFVSPVVFSRSCWTANFIVVFNSNFTWPIHDQSNWNCTFKLNSNLTGTHNFDPNRSRTKLDWLTILWTELEPNLDSLLKQLFNQSYLIRGI